MIKKLLLVAVFLLPFFIPISAMAYGDERTHPDVTEAAISKSKLDTYLINTLGIPEGILKTYEANINIINLLRSGSENEDLKSRASNHFWDPIRNAGLDDPRLIVWQPSGFGNLDWAMGYEYEHPDDKPLDECGPGDHSLNKDCNDYSWRRARSLFYEALTSITEDERNQKFVEFYERLGRVLHLLQDMGVPAHTRNDFLGHVEFSGFDFSDDTVRETVKSWYNNPYELYVKEQIEKNDTYIFDKGADNKMAVFSKPEYYWDNKVYEGANPDPWETMPTIDGFERSGLAEYSNANFLSRRVKFTEDRVQDDRFFFPYPKKSSVQMMPPELVMAEDGIADFPRYLYKDKDGELIPKFALAKYLFDPIYMEAGADLAWTLAIKLDEEVHEAYATYLIPKTVGYCAGLIDFFFRGRMGIKKAFLQKGDNGAITGVEFEIKNTTQLSGGQQLEPFENGNIVLAYKYTPAGQNEAVFGSAEVIYTINDASNLINTQYVPVSVVFSDPIPAGAQDLSFTLVYQGKLGNEAGAVVAKVLPFSHKIGYYYQPGGPDNESNIFTILPDGTGEQQVTNASGPGTWYFSPTWSPDGKRLAFEEHHSDPYNRNIVIIDLTSEASYPDNVLITLDNGDEYFIHDIHPSFSPDGTEIVALRTITGLDTVARGGMIIFDLDIGNWRFVNSYEFWSQKDLVGAHPRWSPLGDKIAYYLQDELDPATDERVFEGEIFVISPDDTDGSTNERLTNDDFTNTQPAWSPDGQKIVFVSDRDGGDYMDIWMMDRYGQNKQIISECNPSCLIPTFSPDGRNIVFKQGDDIYRVNIDSTDLTQVTTSGYLTSEPEASPFLLPLSVTLTAKPSEINAGEAAILTWNATNADTVTIDNNIGNIEANGTLTVYPTGTTTYTITVTGQGGMVSAGAMVNVTVP